METNETNEIKTFEVKFNAPHTQPFEGEVLAKKTITIEDSEDVKYQLLLKAKTTNKMCHAWCFEDDFNSVSAPETKTDGTKTAGSQIYGELSIAVGGGTNYYDSENNIQTHKKSGASITSVFVL
jgi:hypothetical protein